MEVAQGTPGTDTPRPGPRICWRLRGPWYVHTFVFVALVGATCLLYQGDLNLGFFHLDDPTYVEENSWIKGVNAANVKHVLTQPYFANYSPVHLLTYMLDYQLAGANPRAFHLSSNIWAGLVAGFVYTIRSGAVSPVGHCLGCSAAFSHPSQSCRVGGLDIEPKGYCSGGLCAACHAVLLILSAAG